MKPANHVNETRVSLATFDPVPRAPNVLRQPLLDTSPQNATFNIQAFQPIRLHFLFGMGRKVVTSVNHQLTDPLQVAHRVLLFWQNSSWLSHSAEVDCDAGQILSGQDSSGKQDFQT